MNIGMITCTYFMRIYDYKQPDPFNWGEMCEKYRAEFSKDDFLTLCKEIRGIGYNALEIWEPMFSYKVYAHKEAAEMAQALKGIGIEKLVYCIGGWGTGDIASMDDAYDFAKAMGATVLTGCVPLNEAEVVIPAIEKAAAARDMYYAIENHPLPSIESPEDVARLSADYPHVGANLDTGIYNMLGYDVLAAADLLKDKVFHVHFKDSPKGGHGCLPIGDADTPCAALLKKFNEWGYTNMVSVEYEFPTDPEPGLYKSMGYIKGVLNAIKL